MPAPSTCDAAVAAMAAAAATMAAASAAIADASAAGKVIGGPDRWAAAQDFDTVSLATDATGEETTPTTTVSDADSCDIAVDDELEYLGDGAAADDAPREQDLAPAPQLGAGLYNDDQDERLRAVRGPNDDSSEDEQALGPLVVKKEADEHSGDLKYTKEETLFVFDWDDTVLPSSWIQAQGLRLDDASKTNQWQRERLAEVATVAAETLRLAKLHGTVVVVTNAERGWIELSCQKFLPTILPLLENLRMVSARTTYEGPRAPSPLDWKLRAFDVEIERVYGFEAMEDATVRKNVLSLGDGAHEREAVMRSTQSLPNCSAKSLKFVERPDISQIVKQHTLISGCFDQIVQHEGNLDLCIRCE
mmetsp:Transcript_23160/g.61017  ORF Transcript_23160/g.61017 Transcript_23160/m.61017 type:complete len:362 (-) Transcript_23160:124-1209(-)|eukprot:CAMPEP_0177203308 /NCGR_PEP_ID=MMETSP0367-20130122/27749_1 /TAXON_ID=447022 ORGANISM="Scrippsiella hangoei-like, Strain SHHI-4" /NCGR_SAMPLE_ID=MMETSP0367 /ASSEMBLY_ACC=CAM_ASM_000362 /LENGTH=361 /DNA_ID=CAMNT_0018651937 /DNA_START=44 /DNA_END=1129 /DNA_ORIENTATION=-